MEHFLSIFDQNDLHDFIVFSRCKSRSIKIISYFKGVSLCGTEIISGEEEFNGNREQILNIFGSIFDCYLLDS